MAENSGIEWCETCQNNGEIITDWEEYLHPSSDFSGEAGTADCPDCEGGALLFEDKV